MDFSDLQFPENSFDAVYAMKSLLHLLKSVLPIVLRKISKVLKKDRLFFMGVVDHESI